MGRPREFDQQEALLGAMRAFWNRGYEATALSDLLAATGLSKSSLYETFGSKRDLYLAAFDAYRRERMRVLHSHLRTGASARASIQSFFDMVLDHAGDGDRPFGCMSCNEAAALGPHDDEVRALVEQDFSGMESAFVEAIDRGRQDGSIRSSRNARQLARFLTVAHQGVQIMIRARVNREVLDDAVSVMMTALD